MSLIYNKLYKVPNWIVISIEDKKKAQDLLKKIQEEGALVVNWISEDFPITINEMSRKGWYHEVNKSMPFIMNTDFLMVAVTHHLKSYGSNKTLSGTPEKPVYSINRKITNGDDYVRIFNSVLENEPGITLSHLFNIGELCHSDNSKVQSFVSIGAIPKNILQKISDRVITIEVDPDNDSWVVTGCDSDDNIAEMISKILK